MKCDIGRAGACGAEWSDYEQDTDYDEYGYQYEEEDEQEEAEVVETKVPGLQSLRGRICLGLQHCRMLKLQADMEWLSDDL